MMMRQQTVSALALLLALGACSGENESQEPENQADTGAGVFDPMIETLDRAREVQDVVDQSKRDLDSALEDAQKGSDRDKEKDE